MVCQLCDLKDRVLPDDQVAHCEDMKIHLSDSVRQLKAWLYRWHQILNSSTLQHAKNSSASTKTIPQLFSNKEQFLKTKSMTSDEQLNLKKKERKQ